MRRNKRFQSRGEVEAEEVCTIHPSILHSGDMLSDLAFGDSLAGLLPDRLDLLLQRQPITIERLEYRGLG